MSLADELLADLEDVGEEAVEQVEDEEADADVADVIEDVAMEIDTLQQSVKNIAKLVHSEEVFINYTVQNQDAHQHHSCTQVSVNYYDKNLVIFSELTKGPFT